MPRVLIVQHDQPAVRLLAWGLSQEGIETLVAPGDDAPEHLAAQPPDVIVMNTNIDAEHKRTVISALRMLAPAASIIDLAPDAEAAGRNTGADIYLNEPFRVDDLVARIRDLVPDPSVPSGGELLRERSRRARSDAAETRRRYADAHSRTAETLRRAREIWAVIRASASEH